MAKELGIQTVELDQLVESPFWIRQFHEDEEFGELVESVKRIGVIEPPIVRLVDGKMEIVAGHRRVLAARKAELKTVLVLVQKLSDEEAMEIQLCENIHRKDLSDFEKAMFLKKMIDKFGYTQNQLAKKIGKGQPFVSNHLKLLKLEPIISQEIMEKLGEAHGRTILAAPEQKREEIIEKVEETIKETGKPPTVKQIQNMTQIPECERCHTHSSTVKPEQINGKQHNLCDKCSQHAKLHPEEVVSQFRFLERVKEGKVPEKLKPKPQETWQQRKAVMQPQKSKIESKIVEGLRAKGYDVITDVPIVVKEIVTTPDFNIQLSNGKIVRGYIDGVVHEGKRRDKDEDLRELLRKVEPDSLIVAVDVKGESDSEVSAKIREIEEFLKW